MTDIINSVSHFWESFQFAYGTFLWESLMQYTVLIDVYSII